MNNLSRIYPGSKQKYIIVRAIRSGEEVILLWGNPDIQWHKEILEEMAASGVEVTEVFGGGWVFIDSEKGVVHVWGTSDRLGPAPMELVKKVLGEDILEYEPV